MQKCIHKNPHFFRILLPLLLWVRAGILDVFFVIAKNENDKKLLTWKVSVALFLQIYLLPANSRIHGGHLIYGAITVDFLGLVPDLRDVRAVVLAFPDQAHADEGLPPGTPSAGSPAVADQGIAVVVSVHHGDFVFAT